MGRRLARLVCALIVCAAMAAPPPSSAAPPAGFSREIVPGLNQLAGPTAFAFLPDGAMLVTEKYGGIRLYRNGARESDTLTGIPHAY